MSANISNQNTAGLFISSDNIAFANSGSPGQGGAPGQGGYCKSVSEPPNAHCTHNENEYQPAVWVDPR